MSVGNTILQGSSSLFLTGPFKDLVPVSGYDNRALNGNYGTYSVYPVFLPVSDPNNNYKFYLIKVNITNMPNNTTSSNNALPQPYIANYGITYPNGYAEGPIQVTFTVNAGGQSFNFVNTASSSTLTNFNIIFFALGV